MTFPPRRPRSGSHPNSTAAANTRVAIPPYYHTPCYSLGVWNMRSTESMRARHRTVAYQPCRGLLNCSSHDSGRPCGAASRRCHPALALGCQSLIKRSRSISMQTLSRQGSVSACFKVPRPGRQIREIRLVGQPPNIARSRDSEPPALPGRVVNKVQGAQCSW